MKQPIRLLIADDHPFFSEGLSNALKPHTKYEVVATVQAGIDILPAVNQSRPDILVLDINLSDKNGLDLVPLLKKEFPQLKILILSMYMPADIRLQLKNTDIDAYVIKNSGIDTLLAALETIEGGEQYADPQIKNSNHHSEDDFSRLRKLSSREKEILQLLREGYSNKEIAAQLFLSELTVKTHRKNINAKLGAKNLMDLLRKLD